MKRKKTRPHKTLDVEYAVNIVAGVWYQKHWHWYITPMDWWFLDRVKWVDGDTLNDDDLLFGMSVVNEENASAFLGFLSPYEVDTDYLRNLVSETFDTSDDWRDDKLEVMPIVYVNFEQKILKSQFPEPSGMFENFVPDTWQGQYLKFFSDVPPDKRYWILDGINMFEAVGQMNLPEEI